MEEKFEMHCVVEIMGHITIAGKVSEQAIAGQGFIRVDIPKTKRRDGFTRFYGPGAIYSMTPVSEEIAALMAERLEVEAVSEWTLQLAMRDKLLTARAGDDNDHYYDTDNYDSLGDVVETEDDDEGDLGFNPLTDLGDEDIDEDGLERDPGDKLGWEPDDLPDDDEPDAESLDLSAAPTPENVDKALKTLTSDKQKAAQWARDLLKSEFVIFDTETTGFEADDEIIQIGIVDQTGAVVLERLIKPIKSVPNTQYHGITDDMLKDAPGFPEVYEQIKRALQGKVVVAYNFEYDSRMLEQVCRTHGLPVFAPSASHCAMIEYAAYNGDWNDYHGNYRWVKLREALDAFGLKHKDFGTKEHDACTDARATLAVIKKMAEFEAEKSIAAVG